MNQVGTWPATLKPQWESIANAILASTPSAKMVGPAASSPYSLSLTTPFAADEKGKNLVLLTQHYYAGTRGRPDGILATLQAPSTATNGLLAMLMNTQAAAVNNAIPDGYRVGECNTFGGHGVDGLSNALISALWGIDFMFDSALHGASGVNFHGGDVGAAVTSASALYLLSTPESLTAQTGITLAGAAIGKDGSWKYTAPYAMSTSGSSFSVPVPPAGAVLVRVQ